MMISKFNISSSLLFVLIMLFSCDEKSSALTIPISYKRTGVIISSVSEKKHNKAVGNWKMKKIVVSTGIENKIIEINRDVVISETEILDDKKKIIAKSLKDHKGFYSFSNLDSLNGLFYIKDTYPDDFMTLNSGLTVKTINNVPDKKTSIIKIVFEK